MVNFIKHGAGHISGNFRKKILLIKKLRIIGSIYRRDHRAVRILHHKLIQHSGIIGSNYSQIAEIIIYINLVPVKHRLCNGITIYYLPGSRHFVKCRERKMSCVQISKKNRKRSNIPVFPKIKYDVPVIGNSSVGGLWSFEIAEPEKNKAGKKEHEKKHTKIVFLIHKLYLKNIFFVFHIKILTSHLYSITSLIFKNNILG